MDDIINWLSNSGSYADGLALVKTYLRNRNLIKYLERNEDYERIRYELQKLAPSVVSVVKVESYYDRKPPERFDYEALPDELKPYYDRAANAYQVARKWHYAMKEAKSDEQRKECRTETLVAIRERSACWAVLDKWKTTGELPQQVESKSLQALASMFSREMAKLVESPDDESIRMQIIQLATQMKQQGRMLSAKTLQKFEQYNILIPNA